jgi:hypothetical protein
LLNFRLFELLAFVLNVAAALTAKSMAKKESDCIENSQRHHRYRQGNDQASLEVAEAVRGLDELAIPVEIARLFMDAKLVAAFGRQLSNVAWPV